MDADERQRGLQRLLDANSAIVQHLDLPQVLQRIVDAAVELVGARYGALGVIGPDGSLEQLVHVGIDAEVAARIPAPVGHGLLGAVMEAGGALRLDHIEGDGRRYGFPDEHPAMDSFLGVPIRVRDQIFGNLYLADRREGPFTAEDEELVTALAATAGVAIDNARLYDESRRRQEWTAALAEISRAMIAEEPGRAVEVVFRLVSRLVRADEICLVVRDGEQLRIAAAHGEATQHFVGLTYDATGSLVNAAMEANAPLIRDSLPKASAASWSIATGPTLAVPFLLFGRPVAALTVSRSPGGARFTHADIEMAAEFARQAGVAVELARARQDRAALDLVEDRSRIARDLHDHVIQRLFGAGLTLQSIAGAAPSPLRDRLMEQVDLLDEAIAQIRTAIFTLQSRPQHAGKLRHRVLDVIGEVTPILASAPALSFAGPVDALTDEDLVADVVAVLREALTNVARHAEATSTEVRIAADGEFALVIEDDGKGLGADPRSSGLKNMEERAVARGGRFSVQRRAPGITRVEWIVPLPENPPAEEEA